MEEKAREEVVLDKVVEDIQVLAMVVVSLEVY